MVDRFEAVLILKRYFRDAIVPPPLLKKGKTPLNCRDLL